MKDDIEFSPQQQLMLNQLVGFFGKSVPHVIIHIVTEHLQDYVDRTHSMIANYNATEKAKMVLETMKKHQKTIRDMTL